MDTLENLTTEEATELLEAMREATQQVPSYTERYKHNPGMFDRELGQTEEEASA